MPSAPPTVFISYSRANEDWKNRLVEQLRVLEREWDGGRRARRRSAKPKRCRRRWSRSIRGSSATLRRFRGSPDGAASELREAQDIAERGHMRLHEADVHLEWTRLYVQTGDEEAARRHLERARELVASTGYGRREREVAYLEGRLGLGAPT